MFNIPNFISLCRIPLAFIFLQENPALRALAIFLAMTTDFLDGFLARRYQWKSILGTVLDPIADKFFVYFSLFILATEQHMETWKVLTMLSRDFAVAIFGLYLAISGTLSKNKFRAIWCGKITTALQLFVLAGLTYRIDIPPYVYLFFVIFGIMSLVEFYISESQPVSG
jgi:CDP-diacylglycerol--glycerol-3-phosphate 3-phosphatidyltransferase